MYSEGGLYLCWTQDLDSPCPAKDTLDVSSKKRKEFTNRQLLCYNLCNKTLSWSKIISWNQFLRIPYYTKLMFHKFFIVQTSLNKCLLLTFNENYYIVFDCQNNIKRDIFFFMTLDTWYVTTDTWHVTRDTWHMTWNRGHVTHGGGEHSLKV